MDVIEKYVV